MENQLALLNINADNTRLDYKSFTSLAQEFIDNFNKIFEYNNKSIRILGNINEPWFNGRDVLEILEYNDDKRCISRTLSKLLSEEKSNIYDLYKKWYNIDLQIINNGSYLNYDPSINSLLKPIKDYTHNDLVEIYVSESGLYDLILSSRKPSAEPFKIYTII
ncbi:putative antirepressor [Alphaentomopoxvirus acuprea]|uniref:Putative antirepressor n=1 Tax=Alphaentomopoxvirus acuprea TaxID=62099 RepID=W6JPP1_9POXV|nr:putative antirepressor [Anomala cuprea entomopoxvirus]YP_009001732.1 putative antirepressor [Anomala cuprea entomopoxvirus]BAO49365.1 putative antirepressor [Anomala cuprea entomopoxvirus]BAO49619.1 putative antirepressor [Anomala cuprea entomopoxvirus]